jgi:deazaflavin-dependent oxidoreductase (nitroreductase family)
MHEMKTCLRIRSRAIARHPASYRLWMKRRALVDRTERVLRRMSKDRIGVLDLLGLPSIQITVPGRRTGIPRTTPLQYVPDGDAFLVVGSNWGSATHPTCSENLIAAHQVTVRRRNEQFAARSGCSPETSENRPGTKSLTSGPTTRSHTTSPADVNSDYSPLNGSAQTSANRRLRHTSADCPPR